LGKSNGDFITIDDDQPPLLDMRTSLRKGNTVTIEEEANEMTVTATTRARPRPQKRAPVPPEGRAMRPINPRFRELYDKGLTDGDMAAILGAAPSEIILFRETFALPANERPSGMRSTR